MQTKNVNLDNSQQQSAGSAAAHDQKSTRQTDRRGQQSCGGAGADPAPPLPPRGPPNHLHARLLQAAQVDGQGPYKPVPPPKPLAGGHSPPPYRMPPYPLYGETAIPGATATAGPTPASTLHTHSSKFPIEREVILSSTDKNSKIPILHEYKKRPKSTLTAIAPDGPAKQIAWTEDKKPIEGVNSGEDPVVLTRIQHSVHGDLGYSSMGMEELGHHVYKAHPMQLHDGNRISKQQLNQGVSSDFRTQYRSANTTVDNSPYLYNGSGGGASTGAVPRTWTVGARTDDTRNTQTSSVVGRPPALLPHQQSVVRRDHSAERRVDDKSEGDEERSNAQNAGIAADSSNKEAAAKDAEKNKAFSSRTLHSIKDMISSRFGGAKGLKEGGSECVGEGEKIGDSTQNHPTASLNNNQGGGGDKGLVGSPRKAAGSSVQREDGQGDDSDMNHRQHVLGGGPQVIGPSRNYGDIHHGMGIGTGYQGRRGIVEGAECLDRARVAEAEDALRRSGRGKGGPHDHGIYATARNMQHEHYSRSIGDFTRELASPGQEPMYGYHAGSRQHQTGVKVSGNSRMAQNFGSQPGLLDQNGIYMVMRQSGNMTQQQVYGQGTSHGAFGTKEAHYGHQETELRTDFDTQQQGGAGNDNRRCVSDNRVVTGQDRDVLRTQGDENPGVGYRNNPVRDSGKREGPASRRGSQTHLDDEDDDDGGFLTEANNSRKNLGEGNSAVARENFQSQGAAGSYSHHQSSGQSSDYEKATQRSTGQSSSNADSGRGSTIYSSGHKMVGAKRGEVSERLDTSTESSESPQALGRRETIYGLSSANDSEWVDIVESELRQILDPKMHGLGHPPPPQAGANSTLSESISSLTPPLPPLSPGGGSSPTMSPRSSGRYKLSASLPYGSKLEYCEVPKHGDSRKGQGAISKTHRSAGSNTPGNRGGWGGRGGGKNQLPPDKSHRGLMCNKKGDHVLSGTKSGKMPLSASVFGLDTTDLTSTTTGLDSMLDGNTENNSSDDDLSTTIDATDAHTIRKQLEGLENMYSEVLKLLGVKKYGGRYQPSDPRINKRRLYGSMSSLPSSVSSRPVRDKRRQDDRKKVKDMKGINKRFQRLESHVVTLARSVAHLSSEMRTQHLMIQEMENIRGEISALRTQTLAVRSQSMPRGLNALLPGDKGDAALTNPQRVKKLTKFFGDEPPLLRLFLKKLGYEKYASSFENERVGMVELPYMTEERLQKMGIPLGPRLRILQEAQVSLCRDKVYVV